MTRLALIALLALALSLPTAVVTAGPLAGSASAAEMEAGLNETSQGSFSTSGSGAAPSFELSGGDRDFVLFLFICSSVAATVAAGAIVIKTWRSRQEGGMG